MYFKKSTYQFIFFFFWDIFAAIKISQTKQNKTNKNKTLDD